MSTNLEKLDAEIAADFKENKCSLFRSSFERLENEVVKKQLEESALALPYLRVACLLLDFYDYADGRNYRTLWQTHNKRADLAKTWEEVYNHAVNQYEVKSKAWILSGECHGQTSDVWRVIKACASKKSEDGADRFDPSSYVDLFGSRHRPADFGNLVVLVAGRDADIVRLRNLLNARIADRER